MPSAIAAARVRLENDMDFNGEVRPDDLRALLDDHARLTALLTPPTDAETAEAVNELREDLVAQDGLRTVSVRSADIRTLLRAVQAPRLTGEQVEAVRKAESVLSTYHNDYMGGGDGPHAKRLRVEFPAAFPPAAPKGEV